MKTYIQLCLWALAVLWKSKTITKANRLRLWRKTINLFLCFLAFTDKERPQPQLKGAMVCALLSALYDYETDWVPIQGSCSLYRELLEETVTDKDAQKIAWNLFEADLHNHLSIHGLERGSDALAFYKLVIGSKWLNKYSVAEIESHGRSLQIVDDILDLDENRANGHTNCLLTNEREQYLREAKEFSQSDFCKALEENSMIYYKICFRLFGPRVEETPTMSEMIASCRPLTGLFAFVLTVVGFKILKLSLLPAIPIALVFCGITLSIMVFNDLMDKHRDTKKGKTFASRYPWHVFRIWKWVSGITLIVLIVTSVFWWKLALFSFVIWVLGSVYSVDKLSYPINNLLVAFCSGSPLLAGAIYSSNLGIRTLLTFLIVFGTITVTEVIKDIADVDSDHGHKDTLATRVGRFRAGLHATRLCYPLAVAACVYPNLLVRLIGLCFPILVVILGVFCTRFRSTYWAEKAGDLFLTLLLIVLLCTQ